ncbi:MAG: tRNA (adenosine(37)-N6)-dimethylallyltransferase MiaA [Clostridiales bacterium]|nr:tRNA (adenosine(37)-N6)-dimethylallyltransferase MiaA [Clostridiales bacterium]
MKKIPVLAIVGPTASGKTGLSIQVAKAVDGEIVSADSMQIYKGMNIATAKPTAEEIGDIPHHLIDFLPVDKKFSVADYVELAREKIDDIYIRGKVPIVVGGSGLYIDSLFSLSFDNTGLDEILREKLNAEFEKLGAEAMLDKLKAVDEASASRLHPSDRKRIIRALEIYESTGITKSESDEISKVKELPYDVLYIGINYKNRDNLYKRINDRVDMMIENGLLDEARDFTELNKDLTSVQAIGYKELYPYFRNEKSLDECIDTLKKESRHYAKRQITWFKRNEKIHWLYPDDKCKDFVQKAIELTENFLKGETDNE